MLGIAKRVWPHLYRQRGRGGGLREGVSLVRLDTFSVNTGLRNCVRYYIITLIAAELCYVRILLFKWRVNTLCDYR